MTQIVAITGVDGAGKSTIVDLLANSNLGMRASFVHKAHSNNVRSVSKWHSRPLGSQRDWCEGAFARDVGFSASLDFLAHFEERIEPLLGRVPLVICDRYWHCFSAYLLATGHASLASDLFGKLPSPTLIFHITVSDDLLTARYQARGGASEDEFPEMMALFERGYQQLFDTIETPVVQVDNSGPVDRALDLIRASLDQLDLVTSATSENAAERMN